jgi:tetratricopeptide (TPR) repeat protein
MNDSRVKPESRPGRSARIALKVNLSRLLATLLIAISFARPASADTKADAYADEGDKYFKAKDYSNAIAAYQKAVALDPSLGLAYYGMALSYHQLKQWQLAIPNWKRAQTLLQPEAAMLITMGNDYFHLEQYPDAIEAFRSAVQLQPEALDLAMADYWLGVTYNQISQPEQAIAPLRKALRLRPDDPDFNFELGNSYFCLKQYAVAVPLLKAAIHLRPDFAMAYYDLGLVYLAMHKKDAALGVYGELKAIDDNRAQQLHSKIVDEAHPEPGKTRSAY